VSRKGRSGVTVTANDDGDDDQADDSDEGYVTAVERDFRHQTWPPKDYFEKLLEASCPNYSYPFRHKLKDCTMMKNFMTSGAISKGRKPGGGDPGWKGTAPISGEAEVMTIFD
jgi:hypothetical protein